MCGIIAILRRRSTRSSPSAVEIGELLSAAEATLDAAAPLDRAAIDAASEHLAQVNRLLSGEPGISALLADPGLVRATSGATARLAEHIGRIETYLDSSSGVLGTAELELASSSTIRLMDVVWAIERDRLRTARAVENLAGPRRSRAAVEVYTSIQQALSALDRLEVRGRDSAGLHVLVRHHELDLSSSAVESLLEPRRIDPLFRSGAVRIVGGNLSFVYKAAAEIGELGDNTRVLREAIRSDDLLRMALAGDDAEATVLGHTRWASVGIISEPNAHPINSDEVGQTDCPYVTAVLNGDVDNYADLKAAEGVEPEREITTDAKVIPTLVSRSLATGADAFEAFRSTVNSLEGSVAIGSSSAAEPGQLHLALRGSGQALYVGLSEDLFVVASEPYGVVEDANRYIRMDGEIPADPDNPAASRGQIVVLDSARAGEVAGIDRRAYDGSVLAIAADELHRPEVTTRDIDRGDFPHYLLKEISEAPGSFRKTLRGKLIDSGGALSVDLGPETLGEELRRDLATGVITRIDIIGQGTAAVAGEALAEALSAMTRDTYLRVRAVLATELSGFAMRTDMSDTLVLAISQSGTTTDTNRTVDLVRSRGARVVSIVNRRGSDLTDKSDGVLYTSDGRDVEMSVPSTKAFYAQIAAGFLLASALADAMNVEQPDGLDHQGLLASLRDLPTAMEEVLGTRAEIATVARQFCPSRRYWAMVGNGPNRVAARELRIKLSELCYKAIAFDITEDKKHIDLSSEPLILVCAAGLTGSNADDVAKEVGIYRAHRAAPIVIATQGEERFTSALAALTVPPVHPSLAFVLSALVGHLFGYEAALAIDAQADPLREARAAIEVAISAASTEQMFRRLRPKLEPLSARFFDGLRSGAYDGHLEASTATRLASLLQYALSISPLESYQTEYGKVGTPAVVIEDLTLALTRAIDELTRPVDAIKHQAKTVTVGISRSDETLLQVPLVQKVLAAGAARDRFSYDSLRTLAALDPAVKEVLGYTRYRVEGLVEEDVARVFVVDRGGISLDLPLRTESNPVLRGTKHRVAADKKLLVARGRGDGRLIVIVPELKDNQTTGITLLHLRFADELPLKVLRGVLTGYRNRLAQIRDAVTETEPSFREDLLLTVPVANLLTESVSSLADRWRV